MLKIFKGIRGKMIALFGGCIVVILLILGIIMSWQIKDTVIPLTKEMTQEIIEARAGQIDEWIMGHITDIDNFSQLQIIKSADWDEIKTYIDYRNGKISEDYDSLFYIDKYGKYYDTLGSYGDVSDREYFKKIINEGQKIYISNPVYDRTTGQAIIVIAMEVLNDDNIANGIIAAAVRTDTLTDIISQINIGNLGNGSVIDSTGLVVAHIDESLKMKFNLAKSNEVGYKGLDDIWSNMSNGNKNIEKYTSDKGEKMLIAYSPISSLPGWSFSIMINENELLNQSNVLMRIIILFFVLAVLILLVFVVLIANSLVTPIKLLVNHLQTIATGDFTISIPNKYFKRKDEIGELVVSINGMQDSVKKLIKDSLSVAETVGATSEELSASTEEISNSAQSQASITEEMASSMEEMSASIDIVNDNAQDLSEDSENISQSIAQIDDSTSENNKYLEDVTDSVENILSSINNIVVSIKDISKESKDASKEIINTQSLAKDGKNSLDDSVKGIDSIQTNFESQSLVINQLGDAAGQIGDITETIKDIADQTNLLALNASIEAARAGEHGKGFAVVAQAISGLSDDTSKATKDITLLIKGIQKKVNEAIISTEDGKAVIEDGVHLISNTSESLVKIFESIDNTALVIESISKNIEDQSNETENMMNVANSVGDKVYKLKDAMIEQKRAVNEIKDAILSMNKMIKDVSASMSQQASASEEMASGINENSSGIEEISSSSEEIAKSSEELATNAQNLVTTINKFKI